MGKLKTYVIGKHEVQAGSRREAEKIVKQMEAWEKKQKEKESGK